MATSEAEYPHELGVNVIKHLDKMLTVNILQTKEAIQVWFDEILGQCKKSFARVEPEFLPKTPSAKRSKRKYNIISPVEETGERPSKRLSVAKKTRGRRKKGNDETGTETEMEADDESDKAEQSPPRTSRRTRAASRTTAPRTNTRSNRPTRSTRARKQPYNSEPRTASPVLCIQTVGQQQTPKTPNPCLSNNDLKHKLVAKPSVSSLMEGVSRIPTSPKTPRAPVANTAIGSNSPRPIPGYMSVRQRASMYEEAILSSGGNTPTNTPKRQPTENLQASSKRAKDRIAGTPLTAVKNRIQATPSTITKKSSATICLSNGKENKTGSGSTSRTVIQVRKLSTQPVPTTPVSRNSRASVRQSSRPSLRRSLKLSASKSRRSSVIRHQRVSNHVEDKETKNSTEGENNTEKVQEGPNTPAEKPKLRSKLTLKKTKALRPKATRSRAAKKSAEKAETSNSEEMQTSVDISQSSIDTSKASVRRGTVTLSSVEATTEQEEKNIPDVSRDNETYKAEKLEDVSSDSAESKSASDTEKMITESCENPESEPSAVVNTRNSTSRSSRSSSASERKRSRQDSPGEKPSDTEGVPPKRTARDSKEASASRCSSASERKRSRQDSQRENSSDTEGLRPKRTARNAKRKASASGESAKSDGTEATRHTGSAQGLKRSSSQSSVKRGREETPPAEEKEPEGLRPKRTRRATKQASASSTTSSPDSETARPRRSSRAKSRSSKASNCSNVGETSDPGGDEVEDECFAVPEGPAPKANRTSRKRLISETSESENKRPCMPESGDECADVSNNAKEESSDVVGCVSEEEKTTSESDNDVVDRSPSPTCPSNKVVRPHAASFLNNLNKDKGKVLFNINTGGTVKSFLRSSPVKKPPTQKEQELQRRKELEDKQRKEKERLEKRKQLLLQQAEKKKRQREEHLRKVQQIREQKMKKEREVKEKLMEKMEHRNKIPEQVMEVKRKEKQEKKQIREQKHTEAEERRLQEEAERLRKLKEKEEEERQHAELLQRKREFDEQERLKKMAEEKRKQEEHQREMERKRREEELRLQQQQQEAERLKIKQQQERERELQKQRAEKHEREMKELEAKKLEDNKIENELKKLKELERQRIIAENQRQEEIRKIDERYKQLMGQQKELVATMAKPPPSKENLNSTMTLSVPSSNLTKSPQSYQITPTKKFIPKKHSEESYDISGLKSDASTDEEDVPKRKIPSWAQDRNLRAAIVNQYYYPTNTENLFGIIKVPDLNEMFVKKKPRFNKRTSSANWDSPLMKHTAART